MAIRNINSRLDRMDDSSPRTYGRASSMRKQVQRELPTEIVFCDEYTGDVFQLSYNGASQFLNKMGIVNDRSNVEWLIDNLIKMSIDDSFPIENDEGDYAELSVSCKCSYDPQGRSLEQMGIAKSMVCREPSMPPARYQSMQRTDGAGTGLSKGQQFMKKMGIPIGDGKGIMFGREVLELTNALRKGTAGDGSYVGHNDSGDVGGMLGQCNVSGSHRITKMKGWQE